MRWVAAAATAFVAVQVISIRRADMLPMFLASRASAAGDAR